MPDGVRRSSQHCHRLNPYEISLYADGKRTRRYFASSADAAKALSKHRRLQSRQGSVAWTYDRSAHAELTEAKELAKGVDLREVARFYAARRAKAAPAPDIADAVSTFYATKRKLGRSDRHLEDVKSRLETFAASFLHTEIDTFTTPQILEWLLDLKKADGESVGPRTCLNYFAALHSLFAFAVKKTWMPENPCTGIDPAADLPTIKKGKKGKLTPPQAEGLLRYLEKHRPEWVIWACVQHFVGIRDAESERVHGEWIDPVARVIRLPGWYLDGGEWQPGTKTRDDWVIDDIPDAFWLWVKAYGLPKGRLAFPSSKQWKKVRLELAKLSVPMKIPSWPPNALRHGFATYHLSAYRNAPRTSVILRHQNSRKLWNDYVSTLVPAKLALAYLSIKPKKKP